MQDFTLPANIKQIGSIGDGLRIYMEDYVCTFLQQYAESAGFEERIAFLVGKQMVIDNQQYLFIGGAIYGRYAEKYEGHLRFTEKSVDYAEEMLEEFFPNMEIVGWMQSQPSYGTYLNQYYGAYHLRQFRKAHQVMFVVDPLERTNTFYSANPVAMTPADRMAEISGYFIYYEKNKNMHDYMLHNKAVEFEEKPPKLVELSPLEYADNEEYYEEEKHTDERFPMGARERPPEEVIRRRENSKAKQRGNFAETKRTINMLAGLCAVLFVVSFVMGFELVRNQDRLDSNEAQIRQLSTALRNYMQPDPNVTAVFAEDDTRVVTPAETTSTSESIPINENIFTETAVATPLPVTPTEQPTTQTTETQEIQETIETGITTIITVPNEEAALIPPIPETYTIQAGDSLIAISIRFFGDASMVQEILALNGMDNPDLIIEGKTLLLPQR